MASNEGAGVDPAGAEHDSEGNFLGFTGRRCGEHHTADDSGAFCHECNEWCYPESPCVRCEMPRLRRLARLLTGKRSCVDPWAHEDGRCDRSCWRDA